ncbi:MAG: hypothetical protein KDC98_06100 [Planctomycetes bacterium]|nr:hypothetical protein [Planctomycetota bacterium]
MRVLSFAILCCILPAQQPGWVQLPPGIPIGTSTIAWDGGRNRVVLVSRDQTFTYDGAAWQRIVAANPFGYRTPSGMAYDPGRGVTWMFGGYGIIPGGLQNDLWRFDGLSWTSVTTVTRPPARWFSPIVFDRARQRLVLYGGETQNGPANDTWEFDGATWSLSTVVSPPTAMLRHGMAYDVARAVTVLFGGSQTPNVPLAETWEWDGLRWQQRLPVASPPARTEPALTWDSGRGRIVMLGGRTTTTTFADTWTFDGTTWTQVVTTGTPTTELPQNLIHDTARDELVTIVNRAGGTQAWTLRAGAWTRPVDPFDPGPRDTHTFAYDPRRAVGVMFGGGFSSLLHDDTWEYRGGRWWRADPATTPPLRSYPAMSFDPVNAAVLLFGGGSGLPFNDTWLYDGVDWRRRFPAQQPPPRQMHGMTTDTARNRVVMFGGMVGATTLLGDTWEWDGINWLQRAPAISPPPRAQPAMAYDPSQQRTMLYGGGTYYFGPTMADQWEWDGNNWLQLAASGAPGPRAAAAMQFETSSGALVLYGGFDNIGLPIPRYDCWLWSGGGWVQRPLSTLPPGRKHFPTIYDASTERLVLVGGDLLDDTWTMALPANAAVTAYGAGCPGSFGNLALRGRGIPATGNAWFAVQVSAAVPGAVVAVGLSTLPANVALPGGCTALIDQPNYLLGIADGRGAREFDLAIPHVVSLRGLQILAQAAALDPGGSLGGVLTLSQGLQIAIDR